VGFAVAGILACGGTEPPPEPILAPEPESMPMSMPMSMGCATNAECGEGQVCQASVCVERSSLSSVAIGADACVVVSCPDADPSCCSGALATATGNQRQSYSSQVHMLQEVEATAGEVRAEFRFDAPNQQGWLTFQFGEELGLSRLQVTGRRAGVSDRFLSVNTSRGDAGGCAFAFEPFEGDAEGSALPREFTADVELGDGAFCYGGGLTGRASELAFAIFSTEAGFASLVLSKITLSSE
jgi:Cys-rich repeat protein